MITEEFKKEYEEAYAMKNTGDIDFMQKFCEKWDGHEDVDVSYIPYLMRLFTDNSEVMPFQNECVEFVIDSILMKDMNGAIECIAENLYIFEEEQSEQCIIHPISTILAGSSEELSLLAERLTYQPESCRALVMNYVERSRKSIKKMNNPSFAESAEAIYNYYTEFSEKYEEFLKKLESEKE